MCAVGFVLGVGATGISRILHDSTNGTKSLQAIEELDDSFKIPANPIDQIREKALAPLEEAREKWGIRKLREDEIALCVTNLNLGLWKIVQFGAVITEATENCPAGFTNIDRKIACNINMAAMVASLSAATAFLSSTAFLCAGQDKPRVGCTTILAATFEQLATIPAAENQLALFCPKNAEQQTVIEGGVRVFQADARRLGTARNASAKQGEFFDLPPIEQVFCTWQIAQIIWFIIRSGPLIDVATNLCPAKKSSHAACSEVISEILTQYFNAAKFVAAATTNCVDGLNAAAGCALGALNFVSGLTGTASVVSALSDGACSDLDARSKAATEARVNVKIRKAKLIKSKLAHRLLREKKLTGAAVGQASEFIAEEEASRNQPDATLEELFPTSSNKTVRDVRDLVMSHLRSLKSSPLTEVRQRAAAGSP
eukprot:Skav206231  [mRNA]  locus=scaffold3776:167824:169367:+ [translate_table: standard]